MHNWNSRLDEEALERRNNKRLFLPCERPDCFGEGSQFACKMRIYRAGFGCAQDGQFVFPYPNCRVPEGCAVI